YNLCAPAKGETRQAAYRDIESTLVSKPDLVAALKRAFAYCDGAYDALTDDSGTEVVTSSTPPRTRFGMLNWNLWHTWEHYGNVVVYLRIKGMIPPSSQGMQGMQ
ncbi:MAG TPA: DinB family protein, partial [Gemmatimonadales bacterium]|nr:DinB family protein [Gemmatimonadales bacterium]